MTPAGEATACLRRDGRASRLPVALAGAGFAGAVAVRVALAGVAGARSTAAGLVFAAVLVVLAAALGPGRTLVSRRVVSAGLAGAAVLLLPLVVAPLVLATGPQLRPGGGYATWAAATAGVAAAEEVFLRGALFRLVAGRYGDGAAVVAAAAAFALLHLPLYGVRALPLDLAVGLLLGGLRLAAGSWTAPAVAHVAADLAGWWLL